MVSMSINYAADIIIALSITQHHGNGHHTEDRRVHLKKQQCYFGMCHIAKKKKN